jgi:uncharacterized membrane protein
MRDPRSLYRLALASYLLLFVLVIAWQTVLAPAAPRLISVLLLLWAGPLLLALRGVLNARRYTLAWSTLLIPLYFAHGVAAMAAPGLPRLLGGIEIVLSVAYFVLIVRYLRLSNPARRTAKPPREPA